MAALKESMKVGEINDQEESDRDERDFPKESNPNETNSEMKVKKKKKKSKKKPMPLGADPDGQNDFDQVIQVGAGLPGNKKLDNDRDEKDNEEVAEGYY